MGIQDFCASLKRNTVLVRDAVIHIDHTRALMPLDHTPLWDHR
jgi:hypothetical protein